MKYKFALLLSVLFLSATGLAGTVSNIDDAPAQPAVSCPEPALMPICAGFCWEWEHDQDTFGTSCGNSSRFITPVGDTCANTRDGNARKFDVSWTANGGERFHIYLGADQLDTVSTDFVIDTWVCFPDISHVNNIEFDYNQVLANGQTVIFGTQCYLVPGNWEYSQRNGTKVTWITSNATCSRATWTANAWHHVILKFHRDAAGVVTHDSVSFDGNVQQFHDAIGASNYSAGWVPPGAQVVNFQIGGDNSANGATAYLDSLTVVGSTTQPSIPPSAPVDLSGTIR